MTGGEAASPLFLRATIPCSAHDRFPSRTRLVLATIMFIESGRHDRRSRVEMLHCFCYSSRAHILSLKCICSVPAEPSVCPRHAQYSASLIRAYEVQSKSISVMDSSTIAWRLHLNPGRPRYRSTASANWSMACLETVLPLPVWLW
jgi:hypothetical protein